MTPMSDHQSDLQPKERPADPVERVLAAFGGAQALALALDLPVATVEEWRAKGAIPRARLPEIARAAEAAGIELDAAALAQSARAAPTIEGELVEVAAEEPQAERPGWLRRLAPQLPVLALGGVLVVAGFLLAMGTSNLWLGSPKNVDLERRVAALEAQPQTPAADQDQQLRSELAALEQQIAELRQAAESNGGPDEAALAQLRQEVLAEIDRRLAALPKPEAQSLQPLQDEIAALGQRVTELARQQDELRQGLAESAARASEAAQSREAAADSAALVAAAAQLRGQVAAGEPFAEALAAVETLARDRSELKAALDALRPHALEGVATLEELRTEFARLVPEILRAAHKNGEGDLVDGLVSDLSLLLGGRPVGEAEGDSAEARVARAELRLEQGNLADALAEVKALEGAAAAPAQDWIARAEARQASLAAADQVQQLVQSWLAGN